MKLYALLTSAIFIGMASAALASGVGIATSNPGSIYHTSATAIAKVVNDKEGVPATIQPFASPTVFMPAVNSGDLHFGLGSLYEATLAYNGEEFFTGRPHADLRAVGILYPVRQGLFVRNDSPIKTLAEIKGRSVPGGYTSQKIIVPLLEAAYATAGLTRTDMKPVQVPNVVAGADAFASGRVEMFLFAMGAAKVREVDAAVGGIRTLPIQNTPENLAAIQKHFPTGYLRLEKPGPENPGVTEPVYCIAYDGLIFASAKTPEEMVYKMTKAMYENKEELVKGFAVFNLFEPQAMVKEIPLPYHPGAIRFYQEKGLWQPK
ncbi:MAG: TAXI family TRAP transporter solute-binding subunit [Desulfuromonadales bacterium]|nr:TAXI family TRAP transporter solute-binding subunit [Desulfuromonadales bacterium]